MKTIDLQRKFDLTALEVELMRAQLGGRFGVRTGFLDRHRNGRIVHEQLSDWAFVDNIVTNQGLNSALDVHLSGATQITAWKVTGFTDNVTPAAGDTYAVPNFTEITTTDVAEAVRQAWTDGGVSSQSVDNSGSPATYTADQAFSMYGAALVGGGSAASTLDDSAGGGTLWCAAKFASVKNLDVSGTIDITYTNTAADA